MKVFVGGPCLTQIRGPVLSLSKRSCRPLRKTKQKRARNKKKSVKEKKIGSLGGKVTGVYHDL